MHDVMNAIEVNGVSKCYGQVKALNSVTQTASEKMKNGYNLADN